MWQSWVGKSHAKKGERRELGKQGGKQGKCDNDRFVCVCCQCTGTTTATTTTTVDQKMKEGKRKIEAIFCRLKCGGCVLHFLSVLAFSAVSLSFSLSLHRLMTDYSCIGGGGCRLSRRCCTLVLVPLERFSLSLSLSQLCHHSIAGRRRGETVRLLFFPRCFFSSFLFCFHRPLPRLLSLFYFSISRFFPCI